MYLKARESRIQIISRDVDSEMVGFLRPGTAIPHSRTKIANLSLMSGNRMSMLSGTSSFSLLFRFSFYERSTKQKQMEIRLFPPYKYNELFKAIKMSFRTKNVHPGVKKIR